MKRKHFAGLLACLLLAGAMPMSSRASVRTIPVQVDGETLSGTSYLEKGVTYVPLRYLLDFFGGWTVYWDSQAGAAVGEQGSLKLVATPATNKIRIGDQLISGRVFVEKGRTYVPVRKVVEALGGKAEWDPWLGGAAITSPGAAYDARDLYWLSRIISAESGGEPLEGQIGVGNVVLNRVESKQFPDSIPAVIFDKKYATQFEPVDNGTVYRKPTAQSVYAAKLVLDGENTVGKAMYFYAPALSEGVWINANRPYHMTIGCHRFYL